MTWVDACLQLLGPRSEPGLSGVAGIFGQADRGEDGRVLGIMYNRHYLDILGNRGGAQ